MKQQHTPGPWSFHWETEKQEWAIVVDKNSRVIANVNTETAPDIFCAPANQKMPAVANAQVIAASPDLLAAAEAAELWIATLPHTQGEEEVIEALNAAIAKAKGE